MDEDFAAQQRIDTAPPPVQPIASTSTASKPVLRTFAPPAKLEPFLLLAKSARGAGAASLIDQATSASGVFVFAELLECRCIAELESNEQYRPKWLLLYIFAYGTLQDYRNHAPSASLPELSQAQSIKLKQLTLIDLASRTRSLPYSTLLAALELSSTRDLEDLIIECIYADLIKARINQKKQVLEVDAVIGRDVRLSNDSVLSASGGLASASTAHIGSSIRGVAGRDLASLITSLQVWHGNVGETLDQLDHVIAQIRQKEVANANYSQAQSDKIRQTLSDIVKTANAREGMAPGGGLAGMGAGGHPGLREPTHGMLQQGDEMELDQLQGGPRKSPAKGGARKRTRQ